MSGVLVVVPVILAGGSGTRLWPLSRALHPKQYLSLGVGHSDETLFQQAALRVASIGAAGIAVQAPCIVANEEHRFTVIEQLRHVGIEPARVLLEPSGRNTAPALALAAMEAKRSAPAGSDPILVVTPADHAIGVPAAFTAALRQAVREANDGAIVVLGIRPDRPDTGYGYIRAEAVVDVDATATTSARRVAAFVEKPDIATAERYVADGEHYWNSGMFVLRASTWLDALARWRADIFAASEVAFRTGQADAAFLRFDAAAFSAIPAESIDYAVMEPASRADSGVAIRMVPLDAGWSDLGAWDAVWQVGARDGDGNATHGDALVRDSRNTLVHATSRLVGVIGLDDVTVVETADAVLVAHRSKSPAVKEMVAALAGSGRSEASTHRPRPSPLGLVRTGRPGTALPGQAHPGQARRAPEPADAPPPRRALDRRLRHGRGHERHRRDGDHGEPEHLHPARPDPSPRQPREDAARDHRGAIGLVPRRGRHRPLRGQLRQVMKKDARIFVAGHRGMVGSALVRRLRAGGYGNLVLRTHDELDLLDQAAVRDLMQQERPDYVFIAAARVGGIHANNTLRADFLYENLAIGTNLIRAAHDADVARLMFLGSNCIYPRDCPQPIKEEYLLTGPLEPTNEPFAIAKIAGVKLCEAFNAQYGRRYVSAMPTNLYGPEDNYDLEKSHVLPALIRKAHEARRRGDDEIVVWGSGAPRREFLYVDDLADACVFLMERGDSDGATPALINIGTGEDLTIAELVSLVMDVVGFRGRIVYDRTKPDGTPQKLLDVGRLSGLGWRARTSLRDGIARAYAAAPLARGSVTAGALSSDST